MSTNSRGHAITYAESAHSDKEKKVSLDLVKESFGDTDVAHEEYYDWQFLHNPAGKGTVLIAYDGDLPVGQVASIPCKYSVPDKIDPIVITLTMNVCVSPQYRGMGILTELMDRIHKTGQHSVPFSIGIPNSQSMKGHLKNSYHPLPLSLLVRPVRLSTYFSNPIARGIAKPFDIIWHKGGNTESRKYSKRFDERFHGLIDSISHQKSIRQVRNADFLNWRYIDNPRRKYSIFAAFDNEEPLGYLVATVTNVFGMKLGLIVDYVVNLETQATRDLILNALNYFWESEVSFAAAACFPECIEYRMLRKAGFFIARDRFRPHPLAVCLKFLDTAISQHEWLLNQNSWFFMLGDYETF